MGFECCPRCGFRLCAYVECEEPAAEGRKYCCDDHMRKQAQIAYASSGARSRRMARNRTATRGRVCRWCKEDDENTPWSKRLDECERCNVQRYRRSCGTCGGPFFAEPSREGKVGCLFCAELTEYDRMVLREQRRRDEASADKRHSSSQLGELRDDTPGWEE